MAQLSDERHVRTVLVCDDRPELRAAIGRVLAEATRFQVVGEAFSGPSCLASVEQMLPDVLILDVNMPGGGAEVARTAKRIHPLLHIVVYSARQERWVRKEMLDAGADQYVLKTGRLRPLLDALDRAANALLGPDTGTASLPRQGDGNPIS